MTTHDDQSAAEPEPSPVGRLTDRPWFTSLERRVRARGAPGVRELYLLPGLPGREVFSRPRLLPGPHERALMAIGPAGSGKTTLLGQWADEVAPPDRVGWLSLQPGPAQRVDLWRGVVVALAIAAPEVGEVLAHGAGEGVAEPSTIATTLVGCFERLSGPTLLVIDDLHLAPDEEPTRTIVDALLEGPDLLKVAFGSRGPIEHAADPGSPIVALGAADLSFTIDEVERVLGSQPVGARSSAASELFDATGGWPAVVALAVQAAGGEAGVHDLLARRLATDRWVADYVVDELVASQPPQRQAFILETAVLETLSAELADYVRDREDSERHIRHLAQGGLMVAADADHRWWRHHHLVGEVLQRRSRAELGVRVAELRSRAAVWFRDHQQHAEGLTLALEAGDHELAATLLGPALEISGLEPVHLQWCFDQLPDAFLVARPDVLERFVLHFRFVADDEQLARLARLESPASELSGEDWATLCGDDLPLAAAALEDLLAAGPAPMSEHVVRGLAIMAPLANGDVGRAHELACDYSGRHDEPATKAIVDGFASVVAHHLGDHASADSLLDRHEGVAEGDVSVFPVAWARGLRAARNADPEGVDRHFSLEGYRRPEVDWMQLVVRVEHCEAMLLAGDLHRTEPLLEEAVRVAQQMSSSGGLEDRLAAVADALGWTDLVADPRHRRAREHGLSDREFEVLAALEGDGTLSVVAGALGISKDTLKTHLRSIYRKLGVHGREAAVQVAVSWAPPAPPRGRAGR